MHKIFFLIFYYNTKFKQIRLVNRKKIVQDIDEPQDQGQGDLFVKTTKSVSIHLQVKYITSIIHSFTGIISNAVHACFQLLYS